MTKTSNENGLCKLSGVFDTSLCNIYVKTHGQVTATKRSDHNIIKTLIISALNFYFSLQFVMFSVDFVFHKNKHVFSLYPQKVGIKGFKQYSLSLWVQQKMIKRSGQNVPHVLHHGYSKRTE